MSVAMILLNITEGLMAMEREKREGVSKIQLALTRLVLVVFGFLFKILIQEK